jgi:hypothetical protein
MLVNGFLSPWGMAGLIMPFQMVGMAIIGATGGIYGRIRSKGSLSYLETAILGAYLTLLYDFITNVGFAIAFNVPIVTALVSGIVFSLTYIAWNTALFGIAVLPISKSLEKLARPYE